ELSSLQLLIAHNGTKLSCFAGSFGAAVRLGPSEPCQCFNVIQRNPSSRSVENAQVYLCGRVALVGCFCKPFGSFTVIARARGCTSKDVRDSVLRCRLSFFGGGAVPSSCFVMVGSGSQAEIVYKSEIVFGRGKTFCHRPFYPFQPFFIISFH